MLLLLLVLLVLRFEFIMFSLLDMTIPWRTVRLIILVHLISVSLCTNIIANSTNQRLNELILCEDDTICSIRCVDYRSCMASIIQCNNASQCVIHCEGLESCAFSSIYQSSSNHVEIHCKDKRSCLFCNIYTETDTMPSGANNSTFTLHATAPSAAQNLNLHDVVSHTSYDIYCDGLVSCNSLFIHFDPNTSTTPFLDSNTDYAMNMMCNAPHSCANIRMETTDNWYNWISDHDFVYNTFEVNLYCNNTSSCQDATFDFSRLLANGLGGDRTASDFGNVNLFCANEDTACDYVRFTCPDLVPFDAYYDHLYQQNNIKCHIAMESYSELVAVVSKHGYNMVVLSCGFRILPSFKHRKSPITTLWCLSYNPAMSEACIINCDTDYSCYEATLDCADANQCIIDCNAKQACGSSFTSPDWTTIHCPYNWAIGSSTFSPIRSCDITAHPELDADTYGSFFTELWISTYDNNVVRLDHDPTISWFIFDYGMTSLNVNISDYPDVANFSVYDDYFVDNWYRIHNQVAHSTYDPVTIRIRCIFCYNVWILFNGYWSKVGSKSYIECHGNCMNSQIDIFGVTESYILCAYTANSNCRRTEISVVDGYLYTECYLNCDALGIYNNPYLHYDYTVLYDVVFWSYEYPLHDTINIYSLYGFDNLFVSYINYPLARAQHLIKGQCGYPNYYKDCGSLPFLNASCNFTECSAIHPKYETIALATVPFQYFEITVTSPFTLCRAYEGCWNIDIQCALPANAKGKMAGGRRAANGDCLVICHERFACFNSTIYANEYNLQVDCIGYRSCEMLTVYGSNLTQDITVNCRNALSCRHMFIDDSMATNIDADSHGLQVNCYDLNTVLDIVSYQSTSCLDVIINCPYTPTSEQLVKSDWMDPKCHLRMEYNVLSETENIIVRNEANGVSFFDLECAYNNQTQLSSCGDVTYYCDVDDTMSSVWYYDIDTEQHVCNGSCCDFINSESPTSSPTSAPSRAPTSWRYDVFFEALYGLTLTFESMVELEAFEFEFHNHSLADSLEHDVYFMEDIQDALQVAYFESDALPSFADFHVNVTNLTSVDTDDDTDVTVDAEAVNTVFYVYARVSSINSTTVDRFLAITRYSFDFEPNFIDYLQTQYQNYPIAQINFTVMDVFYTEPTDEEVEESFEVSQGTFVSIGVTSCLFILALVSYLYSRKYCCFKKTTDVDDTQYLDVMSYGMQTFDLYTDITFSLELYTKYMETDVGDIKYTFIEFLWIMSLVFICMPYICNLIMAITFQSGSRFGSNLTLNFYTQTWFRTYMTVFCLFVMLSGSVFASLQLVNCKVFGLFIFHAGISTIEIESVDKLKIYYITLLENCPQLVIQIFYVVNFGQEAVTVTFVASTVSSIFNITLTVMSFIARQTSKAKINLKTMANLEINVMLKDAQLERTGTNVDGDEIIPKEVQVLHKRQGRRRALAKNVGVTLNRLDGNFEFLYSVPDARGVKLFGICVSDTPDVLRKQIEKFEKKLMSVVKSTFSLETPNKWTVTLQVPMPDGTGTPSEEKDAHEVEGPEGDESEKATLGVPTTTHAVVASDTDMRTPTGDVEMQTIDKPTHEQLPSVDMLSDDEMRDINDLLLHLDE
eukprot:153266_1